MRNVLRSSLHETRQMCCVHVWSAGAAAFCPGKEFWGERQAQTVLFAPDAFRRIAGSFKRVLLGPKGRVATTRWYAPGRLVASPMKDNRACKDIAVVYLNVKKWFEQNNKKERAAVFRPDGLQGRIGAGKDSSRISSSSSELFDKSGTGLTGTSTDAST